METSLLFHRRQSSFQFAERHSPIRDLARMETTLCGLYGFVSVSARHSHAHARTPIVWRLAEARSQPRRAMTLTGRARHCDSAKAAPKPTVSVAGGAERKGRRSSGLLGTNTSSHDAMWWLPRPCGRNMPSHDPESSRETACSLLFIMNLDCFHGWWRLLPASNWLTPNVSSDYLRGFFF